MTNRKTEKLKPAELVTDFLAAGTMPCTGLAKSEKIPYVRAEGMVDEISIIQVHKIVKFDHLRQMADPVLFNLYCAHYLKNRCGLIRLDYIDLLMPGS